MNTAQIETLTLIIARIGFLLTAAGLAAVQLNQITTAL